MITGPSRATGANPAARVPHHRHLPPAGRETAGTARPARVACSAMCWSDPSTAVTSTSNRSRSRASGTTATTPRPLWTVAATTSASRRGQSLARQRREHRPGRLTVAQGVRDNCAGRIRRPPRRRFNLAVHREPLLGHPCSSGDAADPVALTSVTGADSVLGSSSAGSAAGTSAAGARTRLVGAGPRSRATASTPLPSAGIPLPSAGLPDPGVARRHRGAQDVGQRAGVPVGHRPSQRHDLRREHRFGRHYLVDKGQVAGVIGAGRPGRRRSRPSTGRRTGPGPGGRGTTESSRSAGTR